MTKIISILNHKGGCLKTTVTANLSAGLARAGKKVLVIDLDSRQNLTASLIGPVVYDEGKPTLFDAFIGESGLDDLILRNIHAWTRYHPGDRALRRSGSKSRKRRWPRVRAEELSEFATLIWPTLII